MSQHADEATHLYAGYRVLKCADYAYGREHPPLAKMMAAVPLLASNIPVYCFSPGIGADEEEQATNWLYAQPDWWRLLMRARVAASLSVVTLFVGMWLAARRMFGLTTALVSTAVLAFEPNILGHGALLLNNVLLAAMFLLTVLSFYLWTQHRLPPLLVGTGVCLGLALLTKHSATLLVPVLFLLATAEPWLEKNDNQAAFRRVLSNLGVIVLILALAAATIWCGFGMRYAQAGRGGGLTEQNLAQIDSADVQVLTAMRTAHLLPQAYLDGLIEARTMVTSGSTPTRVLGRYYGDTPWFFFPVATTIKLTIASLAILAMGLVGLILNRKELRRELAFLLLPALLFLAASMRINRPAVGIWHVFPMFPFLIVAAAGGCVYAAGRYPWAKAALVCLLVLHAASSLRAYPNYLSYANELWGGPQSLYKLLPVTDVDQTFWEVAQYMRQHPGTPCWLDSDWRVPVAEYGVPCTQMGNHWENELPAHMKGIVFISSSWLDVDGRPGQFLDSFNAVQPKALLGGGAMLMYEGEFDTRLPAARAHINKALRLLRSGNSFGAMRSAEHAVELAPSSALTHEYYCAMLGVNGYPEKCLLECSIGLRLALANPYGQDTARNLRTKIEYFSRTYGVPAPGAE